MWEGLCTICWFYFVRQELLILGFWRTRIVDSTQIENHFGNTHSHFVDQKQQNGSPNQQNGDTFQQSGPQKQQRGSQKQQSGSLRNNKVGNRSCIVKLYTVILWGVMQLSALFGRAVKLNGAVWVGWSGAVTCELCEWGYGVVWIWVKWSFRAAEFCEWSCGVVWAVWVEWSKVE